MKLKRLLVVLFLCLPFLACGDALSELLQKTEQSDTQRHGTSDNASSLGQGAPQGYKEVGSTPATQAATYPSDEFSPNRGKFDLSANVADRERNKPGYEQTPGVSRPIEDFDAPFKNIDLAVSRGLMGGRSRELEGAIILSLTGIAVISICFAIRVIWVRFNKTMKAHPHITVAYFFVIVLTMLLVLLVAHQLSS